MGDAVATLSLLEQISQSGYRASVITTYSCFFPFYEQVVLRQLVTAGCTHNVVFADARRLAESMAVPELRPRLAGVDYTLIPVRSHGAFHPKLLLHVGRDRGALFVGSHNLTLAGFGLNDELSAVFVADGRAGAAPFHEARDFMRQFLPRDLPEIVEAFESVFDGVPWMSGSGSDATLRRTLLGATGNGVGLWPRIRSSVPKQPARALIVSPFFDESLQFVRQLREDVQPAALTVAIDPASTQIPSDAHARLPGIRFVNIGGQSLVPRRRESHAAYVHAKAVWFQADDGELLVLGSANASAPAFLDDTPRRNAEAIVLDSRPGTAATLGLLDYLDAPEVSADDWATVAAKRIAATEQEEAAHGMVLLAIPCEAGFLVAGTVRRGISLVAMDRDGLSLGSLVVESAGAVTQILADSAIRDAAWFLSSKDDGESLVIIVHRPEEIGRHAAADARKELQQALGALEEDPTQLESILRLANKVIFDADDNVADSPAGLAMPRTDGTESPASPPSLMIEAQGRRSTRRPHLARGDLAYLLDALIRRLGDGLPSVASTRVLEEEIGADEEDGGELAAAEAGQVDLEGLADTCMRKTRKLVKRMLKAYESATPGHARRTVVQLAAVLGVLHALCFVQRRPEWHCRELLLVDPDALFQLFEGSVIALLGKENGLLARAYEDAGGAFEELAIAVGLLGATAYLCEIDVVKGPEVPEFGEEPIDERPYWCAVQLFALLGTTLGIDDEAQRVMTQSVERFEARSAWLAMHLGFAEAVANLETAPETFGARPGGAPRRGDWAVLPADFHPRVRVVLGVVPAPRGPKIVVADFKNKDAKDKEFVASALRLISRETVAGVRRRFR